MKEKKEIKVSLTTVILLFIVFILIVALGGMYFYYNYLTKDEPKLIVPNTENNLNDNDTEKENLIKTINLSNEDKIKINEKLRDNKFMLGLREIVNVEQEPLIYNVNLLNEEKNKYYLAISVMHEEIWDEFKPITSEGEEVTGAAAISVDKVNKFYNKLFGIDMNKELLLNSDIAYGVEIKDNVLYGSWPSGWGLNPFELKAKSLEFNNETQVYTLTTDVLMKVIKEDSNYNELDEDVTLKYGEPEILKWPEEYNYTELKIEYKKDENNNNQLLSLVFVK